MVRRPLRTLLVLGLMALPMLGCSEEDPTGVSKKTTAGASAGPSGSVGGDDPSNATDDSGGNPTVPSPTPVPTPTPPPGFESTSASTGSVVIERPQALGTNSAGDILVAAWPRDPRDPGKPYRLVVMSALGTIKQQVELATIPMAFASRGSGAAAEVYVTDGKTLTVLDASYSVKTSVDYFGGLPTVFPLAITPPNRALVASVAAGGQIMRHPASGAGDTLAFPGGGTVRSLGYDMAGNLWAAGQQKLVRFSSLQAEAPVAVDVTDLGTLNSLAVVVSGGVESGNVWVLGSEKLAYYSPTYDLETEELTLKRVGGPYDFGGHRVFLRTPGNHPVVVDYANGTLTWLKNDGTPDVGGSSGLSQATLDGAGIAGAALDANGNLWVSSKNMDLIRHTRF